MKKPGLYFAFLCCLASSDCLAQQPADSSKRLPQYKNVIRYNLSGAMLFGIDKYIVFGYERVVGPRQSFSVNVGKASLPRLISIVTDSFDLQKDRKRTGYNVSVDYRFYLAKENRYSPPHGLYIGPYYSYNHFTSETDWEYKNSTAHSDIGTNTNFNIHTVGFQLGYQFILWKRFALDLVMVGPGLGIYNYKAKFDSNVDAATQQQIYDALEQLLTQRYPGLNFVFSDQEINSNGVMKTTTIGYRYIMHIGFTF